MSKNDKMKRRYHWAVLLTIFSIILIISPCASAVPVPLGIDGIVYGLDGITRAGKTVNFSVIDQDSGYYIEDTIRADGRYSAAISGNSGDIITVRAWTLYSNVSQTIVLEGVIHNFNMILNLSIPLEQLKIISEPVLLAYEDTSYYYQVESISPEGIILTYLLEDAPAGMKIDAGSGLITWTPLESDIGIHNVTVKVLAGEISDSQSFTVEVIGVNDPPAFTSSPVTESRIGEEYNYDADAIDTDSSSITYSLIVFPPGMVIDSLTGLLTWTTNTMQPGIFNVTIEASDGNLSVLQSYLLFVNDFINHDPVITSAPFTIIYQDMLYVYNISAIDQDGDNITFYLDEAPPGMSVSEIGMISYLPDNDAVRQYNISIRVQDTNGGQAFQKFTLSVINVNDPPVFNSSPSLFGYEWELYTYKASAYDIDGDTVSYSLIRPQPFMSINKRTGLLTWLPTRSGKFEIIVQAKDFNSSVRQIFSVNVSKRPGMRIYASDVTLSGSVYDLKIANPSILVSGYNKKTTRAGNDYLMISERNTDISNSINMVFSNSRFITVASRNSFAVNGEEDAISKITFTIPNNISLERAAFFIYDPAKGIFEETFPISSGYKDKQAYFAVNITLPAQIMFGIRKTREDLENGLKENSISVPSIKKPFVMTGKIIFSDDSPAKEGITYEITNTRTNETVNGVIRKDLNAYAEVISGNIGDEVVMKIGRGNGFKEEKMKITGDVIHKDIDLGITSGDYEYVVLKDRVVRMVPYLIILLMFMAAGMVYLKMREVK